MRSTSSITRIAFGLVGLSTSIILVAGMLGFFPNSRPDILKSRTRFCEAMAISLSTMANKNVDVKTMKTCFQAIVERNEDLLSLGLRKNGRMFVEIGDHSDNWTLALDDRSTETETFVPIESQGRLWGTIEFRFTPISTSGWRAAILQPEIKLAAFFFVAAYITYTMYLKRVLNLLNPSKVIPGRVREALDSLAEGLLVLDRNERIVLANSAFSGAAGALPEELIGRSVNELSLVCREDLENAVRPWQDSLENDRRVSGRLMGMGESIDGPTFSVSSSPIVDEAGRNRGVLASFEDVTQLERKKDELRATVNQLHKSSAEIIRQNRELELLATSDPLTGCFNRRSFFEKFETHWSQSKDNGTPLSAIMVDIDHFKSINDNHGHSMGDEVLREVAATIRNSVLESDVPARYGGEEFAVLMPCTTLDAAEQRAEKIRLAIEALKFPKLSCTASLGVSAVSENPEDMQALLDQADKCLYVAKRNGRNQVVRWDLVPDDLEVDESKVSRTPEIEEPESERVTIPFQAVTSLMLTLAYRDQETAAHSRRVADLCVATAEGILSLKDCYVLEMAALLHDIGKIGVPDSILLKPGPLSAEEWELMKFHERIGVEIVRSAFASPELTSHIEFYTAHFSGSSNADGHPTGQRIPIGARILAIADAYDSMISDRIFRPARSQADVVQELRGCAGTQFDPELVERFIKTIEIRKLNQNPIRSQVSKETALSIGLQIERLSCVLDSQDLDGLDVITQRLNATASKNGVEEIADKSSELTAILDSDRDLWCVMQTAQELLELCRSTQTSLLGSDLPTAKPSTSNESVTPRPFAPPLAE